MIITDKIIKGLNYEKNSKNYNEITTLEMDSANINSFTLKTVFRSIEYLSVQNNNLTDINFLNYLPSIWYLDLRKNPIDNYETLNFINTIGYLALSVEKYSERKILSIRKLNIGILSMIIEEECKKIFIGNNPNIIKFNDEVMYYNFKHNENIINPFIKKLHLNNMSNTVNGNVEKYIFSQKTKNELNSMLFQNIFNKIEDSKNIVCFENKKSINLRAFFDGFNNEMSLILGNVIDPMVVDYEYFHNNLNWLYEEKKKLITLKNIYESILVLYKNPIRIIDLENLSNINNKNKDNKIASKFVNLSILKIKEVSIQIIILVILVLYILQIVGKELAVSIFKYIYKSFNLNNEIAESADIIKSILEIDLDLLIGDYFDIYDYLEEIFNRNSIENNSLFNVDKLKYQDIVQSLKMMNLVLNANVLNLNKLEGQKIYDPLYDLEKRKVCINITLIKLINEKLKNFDDVLKIVQYLSDYILHNKIDNLLLKDNLFQYRIFIEIKELMYNHVNKNSKNKIIYNKLVDRKFTDHILKRLGNKLFFSNKTIDKPKEQNKVFNFITNTLKKNSLQETVKDESNKIYQLRPRNLIDKKTSYEKFIKFNKISKSQSISIIEDNDIVKNTKNNLTHLQFNGSEIRYLNKNESDYSFNLKSLKLNNFSHSDFQLEKINPQHSQSITINNSIQDKTRKYSFDDKKISKKLNLNNNKNINRNKKVSIKNFLIIDICSDTKFKLYKKNISLPSTPSSKDELPNISEINGGTFITNERNFSYNNLVIDSVKNIHNPSGTNKNVYDFRFNIKKLTHHWNSNNKNVKHLKSTMTSIKNIKSNKKLQI